MTEAIVPFDILCFRCFYSLVHPNVVVSVVAVAAADDVDVARRLRCADALEFCHLYDDIDRGDDNHEDYFYSNYCFRKWGDCCIPT